MEYVYGALLLHKLEQEINETNLHKVVASTGAKIDETKIKSLVASLKNVDIAKELENASLFAAAPVTNAGSPQTEKKEEKPKEEKKEAAAEGLSALFG